MHPRMSRERRTIEVMIGIFCRYHHVNVHRAPHLLRSLALHSLSCQRPAHVQLAHFASRFRASGAPGERLQSGEISTFNASGERLHHHGGIEGTLCNDCRQLLEYALLRLKHCPFQEGKTTCGKCPRHCYKKDMKEYVRQVMRFSGPKMIWTHPLLAIRHMVDGLQKKPRIKK